MQFNNSLKLHIKTKSLAARPWRFPMRASDVTPV